MLSRALGEQDARDLLPQITVPTLILHRADDREMLAASGVRIHMVFLAVFGFGYLVWDERFFSVMVAKIVGPLGISVASARTTSMARSPPPSQRIPSSTP